MSMSTKPKPSFSSGSASAMRCLVVMFAIGFCCVDATFVVRTKRQAGGVASQSSSPSGVGTTPYHGDQFRLGRRWGRISVGTPAKEFRVAFNMDSSDLWLIHPSAKAESAQLGAGRQMVSPKVRYDSKQSSTSSPDTSHMFIREGGIKGTNERDNITVADVAVSRQVSFGAVIDGIPDNFLFQNCYTHNCNFDVDGTFGLAPGKPFFFSGNNSILKQMTGAMREPVVTISSKGLAGTNTKNVDGAITFGGVDTENCDPNGYKFVPLAGLRDKWATNLLEIRVGNVTINANGTRLEVVDNYDLAYVPETQFHAIGKALGAVLAPEHHLYYRFPTVKADIVLVIGGTEQPGVPNSPKRTTEIVLKYPEYMYQSDLLRFVGEKPTEKTNNDTFYITAPLMVNRCFALNWSHGTIAVSPAKK